MEFKNFKEKMQNYFKEMTKDVDNLFVVNLDKDTLWDLYLDSFPPGTNKIYRERREYDCNACKHFIRRVGNVVAIKDNKINTIWGFDTGSKTFQPVVDALDSYVKSFVVTDVYVSPDKKIISDYNFENLENGDIHKWEHLYLEMPDKFVYKGSLIGDKMNEYRTTKQVFKRSLEEITEESVDIVLELIATNTLYKGKEWESVLKNFKKCQKEYSLVSDEDKDNYTWVKSIEVGSVVGKIRNHSMGTLLVDISEGMNLDEAVRRYEKIVAPSNYKRSNAIFTKKMLEDAKKTIVELGYMDSLGRRFAQTDDITVNNVLFCNRDTAKQMNGFDDVFEEMSKDVAINAKKFSKAEEIGIDKFISDVLPMAREVELLLENKHTGNMVSLIAPKIADSKTMFKWGNNFSWAYSGNVTDSMKELVKAAGGKVDGALRFSIQWNDGEDYDGNDLDAHCNEPSGTHIYFGSSYRKGRGSSLIGGQLDVDIINPIHNNPAVENITWPTKSRMTDGTYEFWVNCYNNRGGNSGFKAEIEFDGEIYSFEYNKPLRTGQNVKVANVTLKNGVFTIKTLLPSTASSKEVWGLNTNQFIPVSVICYSPNYWDEQKGIGHQHLFFMLKNCINNESPNGYYNEFLKEELYTKHRKVFEALGSKMAVEDSENQLSGVGFSMTKRADVIVKVKGATERVLKIKF
jgi:hypothetical protein